jgi:putative ABC transport system permease protein
MNTLLGFAGKSLLGRRRRFFFLGIAVAFGFLVMTVTTGLTEGLLKTVREKGAFYFSGNVNVTCNAKGKEDGTMDNRLLAEVAREELGDTPVSFRTIYYGVDAQLFFGGATVRQRRVVGLDWASERNFVDSLNIVSGAYPTDADDRGALISETAAKRLGARVGDELMLLVTGRKGRDTASFVVSGIFRDSSIFGYAAYFARSSMNKVLSLPADYATDFGLLLRDGQGEARTAERFRSALARKVGVFPVAYTRAQLSELLDQEWSGKRYMVCTLDAHLSDIKQILDAITAVCYALLAAFLAIVLIGIANTYRVVVFQRSPEIGMMRAMGMSKVRAMGIFVEEAGILALVSVLAGLMLGIALLSGISLLNMPPSMDMFLRHGRISWALNFSSIAGISLIVFATTLLAAWFPARRAARIMPMEAIRTEE